MLQLNNVSFSYSSQPLIENLHLKIQKGEHISIIGASGCGKSTLLQIIYGLHHVEGEIFWKGKKLLGPNFNLVPGEAFIKYLTQDFDLMPPLSVAANVGKYLSNAEPEKKQQRIRELLKLVEMEEMAAVKAKHLSGGQQQRVALARVLAKEPEVLLLDEPFSHIDHFRKNGLRRKLFAYLKEKQITCLVATHDSTDALSFADRTIVMDEGKIIALDTPEELYNKPDSAYVASLFGEITQLPLNLLQPNDSSSEKIILYPHEIKVDPSASLRMKVLNSYFKGSGFLIEGVMKGCPVFLDHGSRLNKNIDVGIKISAQAITRRKA